MRQFNLDEDTSALLAWHSKATGLSISDIIDRLLSTHLPALWELRIFLEAHPIGTDQHELGKNLLVSFGPESILSGIRRIAPEYETLESQFVQSIDSYVPHSGGGQ